MNGTMTKNGDVDEILTRYFQAQLPKPWPAWQEPAPQTVRMSRRTPWLSVNRWAVAASLGALLAAYLLLAGFFPRERSDRLDVDQHRNISQKMLPKTTP